MKKLLSCAIVSLLFLLLFRSELLACKCRDPNSVPVKEDIKKSTAIFIGEVVSIESGSTLLSVKLDVLASYKGIDRKAYVIVRTAKIDEACGFPFKVGVRYLVFTYGDDAFYTSICTRTRPLSEARDLLPLLPPPIFSYIKETEINYSELDRAELLLREIEEGIIRYKDENLLLKIKDVRILLKEYSQKSQKNEHQCPIMGCPPCPPCKVEQSQTGMAENDFSAFYSEFKKADTGRDKLRLVESLMNSGATLSVNQVIALLKLLDFSSDKKKFFTLIKSHIADPQNTYKIYNHLDFSSDKEEAKKILEGK
jgi:hypothetical protein